MVQPEKSRLRAQGKFRSAALWLGIFALGHCAVPTVSLAQENRASSVAEADRLRNAGDYGHATALLKAHLRSYPNDGDAIRMLAQTLYWANDFSGARETYERAINLHPGDTTLSREYSQFLNETGVQRGWLKVSPAFWRDDQPLSRTELQAEAGWFVNPALSVALKLSGARFQLSDTASRSVGSASIAVIRVGNKSGATLGVSAGVLNRSFDSSNELIGSVSASAKLSPTLRLRGSLEREGYFYTEGSLSTSIMINAARVFLSFESRKSFLGEVSAQLQQFKDDNSTTTAYAWVLAPVLKSQTGTVHVGYSGAYQNASELRFELEQPMQSANPGSSSYNFAGRYSPYYTPLALQTHSVIAAFTGGLGGSAIFRLNGGYAVIGSELAPQFVPVASTGPPRTVVGLTTADRDTHPWNARATIELNASGKFPLLIGVETARTAFYSSSGVFASWTLKF